MGRTQVEWAAHGASSFVWVKMQSAGMRHQWLPLLAATLSRMVPQELIQYHECENKIVMIRLVCIIPRNWNFRGTSEEVFELFLSNFSGM
jgi:hypothetical protein